MFTSDIIRKIKYYVYLLSDPISGEIFYVGKGKGNRVFSHLKDNSDNQKSRKIKDLKSKGLEPKIEILVHGVDDETTIKKIEAAIIDLIDKTNLTNIVGGYESSDFGRMDLNQINAKYSSKKAHIDENVVLDFKMNGQISQIEVEKDYDDDLGVEFEEMKIRKCGNDCVFCFVDQNPKNMRDGIYFRDGDYRMSYLYAQKSF